MNRVRKFRGECMRGYDYSNGDGWVYGSLVTNGKDCAIVKEEDVDIFPGSDDGINIIDDYAGIPVIPQSVGDFTGYVDTQGKEVYEGDIVSDPGGNTGVVVWIRDECQFLVEFQGVSTDQLGDWMTVVGNIHDKEDNKDGNS